MKTAGITRRIDNLGRIVIPKEIRKNLRIKNGETLEIYIDGKNNIILKKYDNLSVLGNIAEELGISIYKTIKKNIFITNTEKIIYTNKKEKNNQEISNELIKLIYSRKETNKENIIVTKEKEKNIFITPILSNGDILGSIIIEDKNVTETDKQLIKLSTIFLSKHIED
ncbi:MAG: AbrB/MazE/SpoVT family DNA-binding domain-containing protein [Bacilli bacterium]|nr:AbrB/MazE/SpoVT family DNA-binding domain-containing protein [Bacilli bacterium]